MTTLTQKEIKDIELKNILILLQEHETETVFCKIPSHEKTKACIGVVNIHGMNIVYLRSWNTIVCGYTYYKGFIRRFCTFINSRSSIHHIGLFARYADCFAGIYGYQVYKYVYVYSDKLTPVLETGLTEAAADTNFKNTREKLLEKRFKNKPYFETDGFFNWVNDDLYK